jgi:hypothetical protein
MPSPLDSISGKDHSVAAQVDPFGKQTLKLGFHFTGSRVETMRLSSYGSGGVNLYSPRHRSLYSAAVIAV